MQKSLGYQNQFINDGVFLRAVLFVLLSGMTLILVLLYFANNVMVKTYFPPWAGQSLPALTAFAINYVGTIAEMSAVTTVLATFMLFANTGASTVLVSFAILILNMILAFLIGLGYLLPWVNLF
jgi:hypothetical protein